MRRTVLGIAAHVDAGKTTLSEALLYAGGVIRAPGRVDHGDAFLDTDALERERGITIFSKQAVLRSDDWEAYLLDTPGHADFSAETERAFRVLDCAVLVVSGTDGVQSHTMTLWRLLARYGVPVFFFINKLDLAGADRAAVVEELKEKLDGGVVDFTAPEAAIHEEIALCGEAALEEYLQRGVIGDAAIRALIAGRKLFPCYAGSALKLNGTGEFLRLLSRYAPAPEYPADFGARVFKITRDGQGNRLTWLKVTGGELRVKAPLSHEGGNPWEGKADQLRIYSGAKYEPAERVPAGAVCAAAGLDRAQAGEGLGYETDWPGPVVEPVLSYRLFLPEGTDLHRAMSNLRRLEEEDPQLHVVWDDASRSIHLHLMGEIQREVLERILRERFSLAASFGPAAVTYRETITAPTEGIGHFEPLRHYAEARLVLEPLPPGSGIVIGSACPEDDLARNWQRLIFTHLTEREHPGVLLGAPLTDVRITLTAGRAHEKHTEGGDFREAVYRALRQGLMEARRRGECAVLEPWYNFQLEVPVRLAGRAMTDIRRMNGEAAPPETTGESAVLTGAAPVSALLGYPAEVRAYTGGAGRIAFQPGGFRPCPDQAAVIAASGYDPDRDVENPSGSVFCAHGAGYIVPWDAVPALAHTEAPRLSPDPGEEDSPAEPGVRAAGEVRRTGGGGAVDYAAGLARDRELEAIFTRTYGPKKERREAQVREAPPEDSGRHIPDRREGPEYLLVDGYNIIFAWEELTAIARESLDAARGALCDLLCGYQGQRGCVVIAVFDAYKVKGNPGSHELYHNIHVVYTKEAETADAYIERASYEIGKRYRVRVATSDGPEQLIILGHGALRVSASMFRAEMEDAQGRIAEILEKNNRPGKTGAVRTAIERAMEKGTGGSVAGND